MTAVAEPKVKKSKPPVDHVDTVEVAQAPLIPPKPGEPGFDWSQEYEGEKFMVYTAKTGVSVGLAAMTEDRKPTMGELEEILQKDQLRQMFETVARIASPEALKIAKGFKESDYTKMLDEWAVWSNTTLGES